MLAAANITREPSLSYKHQTIAIVMPGQRGAPKDIEPGMDSSRFWLAEQGRG